MFVRHCTSGCHTHLIQTVSGVASGSFTAIDHDYPSSLLIQLTATDSGGLATTATVELQPKTVNLTLASNPTGLQLTAGATTAKATFTITVIQKGAVQLTAPTPQRVKGKNYVFQSWSDGGGQSHGITAPSTPTTYTATYRRVK